MIDPQFAINRNLNDAGCDETTKKTFLELYSRGKLKEGIQILQQHRIILLNKIHKSQKEIDALDFLLFTMNPDNSRNNKKNKL